MAKADRFDLEEAIVAMRDICDNIELLQVDGPQEKILADIIACSLVHKLKYDNLWRVFLEVFDLRDNNASYSLVCPCKDDDVDLDNGIDDKYYNPNCADCCGDCYYNDYQSTDNPCEGLDGIW